MALRDRLGRTERVDIRIGKRIPVVAGLGGGSADAAAVLRCLARAWKVRDRRLLAEVALEIGSDVPFFLGSGPAWAGGRGERLRPVRVAPRYLVLLYPRDPALAIRAGDAYRWLDEDRGPAMPRRAKASASRPENDLMAPCVARRPSLRVLLRWLEEAGATAPIMSGSGPTMVGSYADLRSARAAARQLAGRRLDGAWSRCHRRAVAGADAGGRTMEITEVRIFPVHEDKLKAYVTITLDHCFVVRGLKVIHGTTGLFVAMPAKRRKDGTFKDIAHPLNTATRERMERVILSEYDRELARGSAPQPADADGLA